MVTSASTSALKTAGIDGSNKLTTAEKEAAAADKKKKDDEKAAALKAAANSGNSGGSATFGGGKCYLDNIDEKARREFLVDVDDDGIQAWLTY